MRYIAFICIILSCYACDTESNRLLRKSTQIESRWSFVKVGDSAWYPARVPGVIHLDLMRNGIIENPFWQDNELKQRWIEDENWAYQTVLFASQELLENERVSLVFEGLDTYATVYVNDQEIISANNMFRSWEADVKSLLLEGGNTVRVEFESPIEHNRESVNQYKYALPSGNETNDIETKVYSFTRKAAYHFGWDWGPRFVTSGIWKPVKLESWNKAKIKNASTRTIQIESSEAHMQTLVEVEVSEDGEFQMQIAETTFVIDLKKGVNQVRHDFVLNEPRLWWANGYGKPNLYTQKIKLLQQGQLLDQTNDRYGVRTIELINEPDSIGTSFYFVLNGQPVFIKGANYIPQDVFLPRVSDSKYDSLIISAKEANFNMLRVWGGGIYEKDVFYNSCDEYGIMVWQDFMFAGSLYPDNQSFKENIRLEVVENVKRLRSHPSIALWCGNNEIEVAWGNWGWQKQFGYSSEDSMEIWNNYKSIFHDLIPSILQEHDPSRSYTHTSPLSNWGSAENFNHGSMHYWGVWHGKEPFENYNINVGRFMVEYGFQSYPEMATLRKVLADSSLYLDSPLLAHRQKSYIGNGLIHYHIFQEFGTRSESIEDFVELSQKAQVRGLQIAIRAHMKQRPHCMGSLFWQFNDCWPGPSWSVIDYFGNKKQAYYTVKEEYLKR